MLNFMSPWMTQFTREKHDGKRDPQRNMTNRKPSAGEKCGYIAPKRRAPEKTQRVIDGLEAHLGRHPRDRVRATYLAKLKAAA